MHPHLSIRSIHAKFFSFPSLYPVSDCSHFADFLRDVLLAENGGDRADGKDEDAEWLLGDVAIEGGFRK